MEPPLAHQIAHATHIFAAEVVSREHGTLRHRYDLKGRFAAAGPFSLDLTMHRLLGFQPLAGDIVYVFLIHDAEPLELLPVRSGRVVYAPSSAAREEHSIAEFESLVREGAGE